MKGERHGSEGRIRRRRQATTTTTTTAGPDQHHKRALPVPGSGGHDAGTPAWVSPRSGGRRGEAGQGRQRKRLLLRGGGGILVCPLIVRARVGRQVTAPTTRRRVSPFCLALPCLPSVLQEKPVRRQSRSAAAATTKTRRALNQRGGVRRQRDAAGRCLLPR